MSVRAARMLAVGSALWLAALGAARGAPQPSGGDDAVAAGRAAYQRECATCHGEVGTGYGPARLLLRQPPADLTLFSSRTRPFDRESIRAVITGRIRLEPPHGFSEMPRWRVALDTTVPTSAGPVSELDALLTFLDSIQLQRYGSPPVTIEDLAAAGAPLFKTHCAECHGDDGRGGRLQSYTVGLAVPDLSAIAQRTGGDMNMRELYESIVGRHPEEDDAMPAWGRVLRRRGWPEYLTMKNLEAIAWYVESIQRR